MPLGCVDAPLAWVAASAESAIPTAGGGVNLLVADSSADASKTTRACSRWTSSMTRWICAASAPASSNGSRSRSPFRSPSENDDQSAVDLVAIARGEAVVNVGFALGRKSCADDDPVDRQDHWRPGCDGTAEGCPQHASQGRDRSLILEVDLDVDAAHRSWSRLRPGTNHESSWRDEEGEGEDAEGTRECPARDKDGACALSNGTPV